MGVCRRASRGAARRRERQREYEGGRYVFERVLEAFREHTVIIGI